MAQVVDSYVALKAILNGPAEVKRAPSDDLGRLTPSEMRVVDSTDSDQMFLGDGQEWLEITSALQLSAEDPADGADAPFGPTRGGGPRDLNGVVAQDGAIAVHDGTGTTAGRSICEYRDDDGDWYHYDAGALLSNA